MNTLTILFNILWKGKAKMVEEMVFSAEIVTIQRIHQETEQKLKNVKDVEQLKQVLLEKEQRVKLILKKLDHSAEEMQFVCSNFGAFFIPDIFVPIASVSTAKKNLANIAVARKQIQLLENTFYQSKNLQRFFEDYFKRVFFKFNSAKQFRKTMQSIFNEKCLKQCFQQPAIQIIFEHFKEIVGDRNFIKLYKDFGLVLELSKADSQPKEKRHVQQNQQNTNNRIFMTGILKNRTLTYLKNLFNQSRLPEKTDNIVFKKRELLYEQFIRLKEFFYFHDTKKSFSIEMRNTLFDLWTESFFPVVDVQKKESTVSEQYLFDQVTMKVPVQTPVSPVARVETGNTGAIIVLPEEKQEVEFSVKAPSDVDILLKGAQLISKLNQLNSVIKKEAKKNSENSPVPETSTTQTFTDIAQEKAEKISSMIETFVRNSHGNIVPDEELVSRNQEILAFLQGVQQSSDNAHTSGILSFFIEFCQQMYQQIIATSQQTKRSILFKIHPDRVKNKLQQQYEKSEQTYDENEKKIYSLLSELTVEYANNLFSLANNTVEKDGNFSFSGMLQKVFGFSKQEEAIEVTFMRQYFELRELKKQFRQHQQKNAVFPGEEDIHDILNQLDQQLAILKERLKDLNIIKLAEDIDDFGRRVMALVEKLEKLRKMVDEEGARLEDMQNRLDRNQERLDELGINIDELGINIKRNQMLLDELSKTYEQASPEQLRQMGSQFQSNLEQMPPEQLRKLRNQFPSLGITFFQQQPQQDLTNQNSLNNEKQTYSANIV